MIETKKIFEICDKIKSQELVLPDIQRKFVWNKEKIVCFFDSIMRGYPINTMMFWRLNTRETSYQDIVKQTRFFKFLDKFVIEDHEENDLCKCPSGKFDAVIDGQQRLTSIYLGFYGVYSDDKKNKEPQKLCISLSDLGNDVDNDTDIRYRFDFQQVSSDNKELFDEKWFVLNKIHSSNFNYKKANDREIRNHIKEIGFSGDDKSMDVAVDILLRIREVFFNEELISSYIISDSDLDEVLDIFVRANSGGKPLTPSELLMSVTTKKWSFSGKDTREAFKEIREDVKLITPDYPFKISNDFILNCCLMIFSKKDIKARVSNFTDDVVRDICNNWQKLTECIVSAFRLINHFWRIDGYGLKAYNAVVPIVYYIYLQNLQGVIDKSELRAKDKEFVIKTRDNIRLWFTASLLKGVFGGQSVSLMTKLKGIIKDSQSDRYFPVAKIFETFDGTNKDLYFQNETQIDKILQTQYQDQLANTILAFLYPEVVSVPNSKNAKDHVHPKKFFEKKYIEESEVWKVWTEEERKFAQDKNNWNSILNLQLLDFGINSGEKKDKPLKEWLDAGNMDKRKSQYIPIIEDYGNGISYELKDFKPFIEARKELLITAFKDILKKNHENC